MFSGLPPIADIGRRGWQVSSGPLADHAPQQTTCSFDDLICGGEQRRWDIKAQ